MIQMNVSTKQKQTHQRRKQTCGCQGEGVGVMKSELHTGASLVELAVKNPSANAGDVRDVGLIPGSGRSPGRGHGNPLEYSCLENPMDRGAWWATVHGVSKESDTSDVT